jgi:hypothetical protein
MYSFQFKRDFALKKVIFFSSAKETIFTQWMYVWEGKVNDSVMERSKTFHLLLGQKSIQFTTRDCLTFINLHLITIIYHKRYFTTNISSRTQEIFIFLSLDNNWILYLWHVFLWLLKSCKFHTLSKGSLHIYVLHFKLYSWKQFMK